MPSREVKTKIVGYLKLKENHKFSTAKICESPGLRSKHVYNIHNTKPALIKSLSSSAEQDVGSSTSREHFLYRVLTKLSAPSGTLIQVDQVELPSTVSVDNNRRSGIHSHHSLVSLALYMLTNYFHSRHFSEENQIFLIILPHNIRATYKHPSL